MKQITSILEALRVVFKPVIKLALILFVKIIAKITLEVNALNAKVLFISIILTKAITYCLLILWTPLLHAYKAESATHFVLEIWRQTAIMNAMHAHNLVGNL